MEQLTARARAVCETCLQISTHSQVPRFNHKGIVGVAVKIGAWQKREWGKERIALVKFPQNSAKCVSLRSGSTGEWRSAFSAPGTRTDLLFQNDNVLF